MLVLDSAETRNALPFPQLIDALRVMFSGGGTAPPRHHHEMEVPGEAAATLLLMPAWVAGRYFGVKMVSVFPGNGARGLPAIYGSYLLSSGLTGELLAVMDGGELTARRTAAASALASSYLSRPDASTMLMVGTGRLSLNLIEAHAVMRPLARVLIWGRDSAKAEAIAEEASSSGLTVEVAADLESAAREADIISCATLSEEPLIRGDWLKPGAHLDLVGAFKPSMRESDDRAVACASLFVDTYEGALAEAGDILQPLKAGVIEKTALKADLADLCAGRHSGRASADEITLFKSVGASIEDLAGAILALEQVQRKAAEEL
ncbi:ornithine cyclodeaminase family protein [Rhizobium sp. TRM95796]|uniref:ornithine cyclodeaminase family protein n=1 Tax=Rhizobium sp. TRM95796 TaxID=2979862 RepID=UPI0021E8471A|nr:ornithine cyclodeaminase family protein [Rhizobium sp. TRM95796]MCV3767194.1 ornithine cyclodeaminase family protein [Rhizobium sp. TRM95796]